MPQAKPRVAALLDVTWWTAEAADQEVTEPLLGAGQIVRGIHRTNQIVTGHLPVEGGDEPPESVLANGGVDITLVHAG